LRRKDREVTDKNDIISIISKCNVCRLGLVDDGEPYVVPMNFGFEFDGVNLTLYFHSAKEGRKIDILRKNPLVCFEMDCGHELISGGTDIYKYSYKYESVIGIGNAEFIEGYDEKVYAFKKIMAKYAGTEDFDFPPESVSKVAIIKIQSNEYTGKKY